MLSEIRIVDLALIDELSLSFVPGLNIITGETGAGKSMVVEAINLLAGGKGDASRVRRGCEATQVEGLFLLEGDRETVLRRRVGTHGRGRSYIDGRLSTLRELSTLGGRLVETHGQHGHQALLISRTQLEIIDRFGGAPVATARGEYHNLLSQRQEKAVRLAKVQGNADAMAEQRRFLEWRVEELERAGLVIGEDRELEGRIQRLRHAAELSELICAARESLDGPVIDGVQGALARLERAATKDGSASAVLAPLRSAAADLDEAASLAREYAENLSTDTDDLDELQERLFFLKDLMKKYGLPIEGLIEKAASDRDELTAITSPKQSVEELASEVDELDSRLIEAATRLSAARRSVAKVFAAAVNEQLQELGFGRASFKVDCVPVKTEAPSQEGCDRIEFVFSGNVGEPERPLASVASGGELARVMLAIRSVFGHADSTPTLLFDEIDAGIGGKTAVKVGERLAWLAKSRQVICVTHLAQVAAFADHHIAIKKSETGERARIGAEPVSGDERLLELARLGGSVDESVISVEHARQLRDRAEAQKLT